MRILVVGAVGGYFGGRLLASRCGVTFLVCPRRPPNGPSTGLVILSPAGDVSLPVPRMVIGDDLREPSF